MRQGRIESTFGRRATEVVHALSSCLLVSIVVVTLCAPTARSAIAAEATASTPPRLSLVDGVVSFWRSGAPDWTKARVNTPIAAGDALYTASGANCEVQIGPQAFLRAGASTELSFSDLWPDLLQLALTAGQASLDLRELSPGLTVEIDTPNAAFTIDHAGYYRVNVEREAATFITRRGGTAIARPADGPATLVRPSEEVVVSGADAPALETYAAPDLDGWDRWSMSRTDQLIDAMSSRHAPGVYGAADLDQYGNWRTVPEYGAVWIPEGVPAGWVPYSTGNWIYDPSFGWTWVDDAPWGWAPFHYGRWVFVDGFWAWAPGPVVLAPIYAPACVGWLGGAADIGIGWVALGWGEPLFPWWGPPGFIDWAWWGGWGGPWIVNGKHFHHHDHDHHHDLQVRDVHFANAAIAHAVVASREGRFGRDGREYLRPSPAAVHALHAVDAEMRIRPTATSLAPGAPGERPPEDVQGRRVVATRQPRDPISRLHDAGLDVRSPVRAQPQIAAGPAAPNVALAPGRGHRPPPVSRAPAQAQQERLRPPPPPRFDEWWASHEAGQAPAVGPRHVPRDLFSPPKDAEGFEHWRKNRGFEPPMGSAVDRHLPGQPAMRLRSFGGVAGFGGQAAGGVAGRPAGRTGPGAAGGFHGGGLRQG
jgi:hypothetical protein